MPFEFIKFSNLILSTARLVNRAKNARTHSAGNSSLSGFSSGRSSVSFRITSAPRRSFLAHGRFIGFSSNERWLVREERCVVFPPPPINRHRERVDGGLRCYQRAFVSSLSLSSFVALNLSTSLTSCVARREFFVPKIAIFSQFIFKYV